MTAGASKVGLESARIFWSPAHGPEPMRHYFLCCLFLSLTLSRALAQSGSADEVVSTARDMLDDVIQAVSESYYPPAKVDAAFRQKAAATEKLLGTAKTNNAVNALIGDLFLGLDPRIRLYPPFRSVRVDYGWNWQIIGDAAYVTHLDTGCDAVKQGLKVGDRILTVDGAALTRATSQQVYYLTNTLVPRPGRRLMVQSGQDEPHQLDIAATMRPPFQTRSSYQGGVEVVERVLTDLQKERLKEFRDPGKHLRRVGPVLVWRAEELHRDNAAVAEGLKAARDATALILDLRGRYVSSDDTVFRLLDGLFGSGFDVGTLEQQGLNRKLRVAGRNDAFTGTLLVLVDSGTANYAELAAHVIQQRQRGILIGDHTMGRVFEHERVGAVRGMAMDFMTYSVVVPAGELRLADGTVLDGKGVAPDLRLLPKPADLAGHRDVVLAKALAMLKQPVTPEEAYMFFRNEPDDDEG